MGAADDEQAGIEPYRLGGQRSHRDRVQEYQTGGERRKDATRGRLICSFVAHTIFDVAGSKRFPTSISGRAPSVT